jgi:hypothetical protein
MPRTAIILLFAAAALAADGEWDKVKKLESGTDVRIVKKGAAKPVTAKFDEAREDSIVVVVRNEQVAIERDLIDRIDAKLGKSSRVTTESKTTTEQPDARPQPKMGRSSLGNTSYSSGIRVGSGAEYETVYKRASAASQKAPEKK